MVPKTTGYFQFNSRKTWNTGKRENEGEKKGKEGQEGWTTREKEGRKEAKMKAGNPQLDQTHLNLCPSS